MGFAKLGSEIVVNADAGDQFDSAVTQLNNGNIVVTWTDENGTAVNVFGQILSADGQTKIGGDFRLNTTLDNWQYDVAVTALGDGGFVAGWTSSADWPAGANFPFFLSNDGFAWHVVTQVFDSSGNMAGGEQTHFLNENDYGANSEFFALDNHDQYDAALTANVNSGTGEFDLYFAEYLYEYDNSAILFPLTEVNETAESNIAHFTGGTGETLINPAQNLTWDDYHYLGFLAPRDPGLVVMDTFGDTFAITLSNGTTASAYVRRSDNLSRNGVYIDIPGAPDVVVGSEDAYAPSIAELTNGDIIAVWMDTKDSSDGDESIKAQLIAQDGAKIGAEFLITHSAGFGLTENLAPEGPVALAALTDGRFIVVWQDVAGDGSSTSINAQVYTAAGEISGEEFIVNTTTAGEQMFPTVTALANGDAIVSWTDASGTTGNILSQVLDLQTYVGDSSAETVYGGTLDDHLDGGGGADILYGEQGDDVFESVTMDDLNDGDVFDGGAGTDTLDFDDYVLEWGGPPVLIGDNGTVTGVEVINLHGPTVGAGINSVDIAIPLANNTSNDTLTVNGALALDIIYADRISNTAVEVFLNGGGGDDQLFGGAGANHLNGGTGVDYMHGGGGNDTFTVDSSADVVEEELLQGTDLVLSSIDYTIGAYVENLTLTGSSDIDGTGNSHNNIINGNSGGNRLEGEGGLDHLYGLGGADYLYGGSLTDWLYGGNEDDNLYGEDGDDVLVGGLDNDELDGGTGTDYMQAGQGDDLYVVDNTGDRVVEYDNQGTDLVLSSITAIAPAYTENLWLTGTANISGIGNLQDNMIIGNSGINVLSGVIGDDMLYGFAGADLLWGGAGGDTMDGGENNDTVTYLGSAVGVYADIGANLYFGGDANGDVVSNVENLIGSAHDDVLVGDGGNNWLNGGAGADTLAGGGGNDTYVIDNVLDEIIEIGGGIDTVLTSLTSFTLAAELEKLAFTSAIANIGVGNELDNTLTGNIDVDILTGLAGNDTLIGRDGNDVLRGGLGADVLNGGLGIADLADYIGATAAITAALDGSLAGAGEALGDTFLGNERLRGSNFDDTLTGDGLDNILFGQDGIDTMNGLAGVDRLFGGNGIDTLTGGAGADRFEFGTLTEIGDIITDFSAIDDTIVVTASAFGGGLVAGTLNAAFFQSRADNVAQDADDRFIFQTTDQTLWFDADGNGAGAAVLVADLQAGATVTNADILVI
ncbi:MAG: hypothetical protein ACKVP5_22275 [Aestuariivirga sp.]